MKDETIFELQKEVYALKLEKVEVVKKELEEKLSNLSWSSPKSHRVMLHVIKFYLILI